MASASKHKQCGFETRQGQAGFRCCLTFDARLEVQQPSPINLRASRSLSFGSMAPAKPFTSNA